MQTKTPVFKYNNTLLLDDNDMDNFINEKMLESTFFSKNIIVSANGTNALDILNNIITSPEKLNGVLDVMFVDLNMPVMNGFEFIENFKKINNKKLSNCRIVILTSSIDDRDKVYAKNLDPAIIFINKPLTNEFLKGF